MSDRRAHLSHLSCARQWIDSFSPQVDSLMAPVDAAMFSMMLWEHQPELIIEIGTECARLRRPLSPTPSHLPPTYLPLPSHSAHMDARSRVPVAPSAMHAGIYEYDTRAPAHRRALSHTTPTRVTSALNLPCACLAVRCGGSAVFFASIVRAYNPLRGRVLTYDVRPTFHRCSAVHPSGRKTWKGYRSPLWKELSRQGTLEARVADVTSPPELARIAKYAADARSVWIFDDGDHFATPLLVHFHLLSRHVSPGGYYLIADTRLERTCRSAWMALRVRTEYCLKILTMEGGPARALHYLRNHHPSLVGTARAPARHADGDADSHDLVPAGPGGHGAATPAQVRLPEFAVDRKPERWVLTQHPGGWLRRVNRTRLEARRFALT